MPLTSTVNFSVSGVHSTALDLGTASLPFTLSSNFTMASGTAASQADRVWTDTRTLGISATEDLDLAGSALLDAFGVAAVFVKLKALIIKAAAANTNNVQLSRPAGAIGVPLFLAISDGIVIPPGYTFAWFGPGTGITVTPATGDVITITNGGAGTGVTYDIVIIGTSA
jgi:hypothetical protein